MWIWCVCVSDVSVDHRHANTAAFSNVDGLQGLLGEDFLAVIHLLSVLHLKSAPSARSLPNFWSHTLTRLTMDTCSLAGWLWCLTSTWRCDRDFLPAGTRCISVVSVSESVRGFVSDSWFFSLSRWGFFPRWLSNDVQNLRMWLIQTVTCKPVAPSHTFSPAQSPYRHLRLLPTRKHPAATKNKQEALLRASVRSVSFWVFPVDLRVVTLPVTDINI